LYLKKRGLEEISPLKCVLLMKRLKKEGLIVSNNVFKALKCVFLYNRNLKKRGLGSELKPSKNPTITKKLKKKRASWIDY
jgi:hypothetical protein